MRLSPLPCGNGARDVAYPGVLLPKSRATRPEPNLLEPNCIWTIDTTTIPGRQVEKRGIENTLAFPRRHPPH